jgi:hypothetical protein
MIKKYYAAHIKTRLDAATINVMRPHKFKNKMENKVRPKFQASPATSDHDNPVNLGKSAYDRSVVLGHVNARVSSKAHLGAGAFVRARGL